SRLGDRGRALDRAVEGDLRDAGEADPANGGGGALQDRGLFLARNAKAHEFGALRLQIDRFHLSDRYAGEGHRRSIRQPVDGLAEIDVIFATGRPTGLAQPDDEREQRHNQGQYHAADQDMVGTSFHQPSLPPAWLACAAARPRGPRKYSCIHSWSKANSSGIVPTATTFRSASTATRSQIAYSVSRSCVIRKTVSP